MRQSVHVALTTCRAPLPPGKKYVGVRFLTKEIIYVVVDAKGKGQEVFEDSCKHLGLLDGELFGLAIQQDGEYIFVDKDLKISKYAGKSWKTHANGVCSDGQPLLVLHMRIQHYVDCHFLISEKVVRNHYYLQLLENVKTYNQAVSEEKVFLLAALALQADLGNYYPEKHKGRYFDMSRYFPAWVSKKIGSDYIVRHIPFLHKDNAGLSRAEAQVGYIKEASDITAPHNLHFYKMRRKKGRLWSSVWLGIRDSGIHIYEESDNCAKSILSSFSWCDIGKLHFEKKKFEIQSEGSPEARRFTYYVQSEELAKYLLWICRETHHFHMANQIRVQELKKLELEGGKTYREAYIYTDMVDQAREKGQSIIHSKHVNGKPQDGVQLIHGLRNIVKKNSPKFFKNTLKRKESNECIIPSSFLQHHSMEALPLINGHSTDSGLKFRSQSLSCFSSSFNPCHIFGDEKQLSHLWNTNIGSSLSTTPTSTLMSRSSCASNTDSACSSLSLASGSTVKASTPHACKAKGRHALNDSSQWLKCDSFEEISVPVVEALKTVHHKVCISTFIDNHVRTASVYDSSLPSSKAFEGENKPATYKSVLYVSLSSSPVNQTMPVTTNGNFQNSSGDDSGLHTPSNEHLRSENSHLSSSEVIDHPNETPVKYPSPKLMQQSWQNSVIPYQCNVKIPTHFGAMHNRTAIKIGVSSLSRDQRIPLTLFDDHSKIKSSGSEPNLYNTQCQPSSLPGSFSPGLNTLCQRINATKLNSRSELCLSAVNQNHMPYCSEAIGGDEHMDEIHHLRLQQSPSYDVPDSESSDFPCIPPPPAYRNSSDDGCSSDGSSSDSNVHKLALCNQNHAALSGKMPKNLMVDASKGHSELRGSLSSPPDVLDLHQLRQKSRDLDLPLISALCNDRSLLMLPKTVPTCSRQRHRGARDTLSHPPILSNPPIHPTSHFSSASLPNGGRPMSWHVDSLHASSWNDEHQQLSCSSTWTAKQHKMPSYSNVSVSPMAKPILPPTILTSFGPTPEKQTIHPKDLSYYSGNHRTNQIQMIPTKLLSGTVGPLPNGRMYQKGSSS